MQDLIAAMLQEGFHVQHIEADGKVRRFNRDPDDRKKSAWYVCFLNHTRKGDAFHVCIYGDWRDTNEYKYCDLKNENKEDKKFIENKIAEAQRQRAIEQEKVWEEAALEASADWASTSNSGPSTYLDRKKVDAHGVKVDKGTVFVPIIDEKEKLWGIQKIFSDGTKRFTPSAKVKGNFHLIGGVTSEMLVCEGYSTGASLHAATGLSVLICFFASNLPEVCRKFPDSELTVCGDDDLWISEDKGGNAGRKYAAKCAASRVIFPVFQSLDGEPTDFNDLHVREGLDIVRNQILNSDAERNFVIPLGHKDTWYYYTSSSNRQIVKIGRESHTKNALRDLMPDAWWTSQFPKTNADAPDWDAAANSLMMKCRKKGIFDDNMVRGVGVWKDQEKFLINLGDGLYYAGQRHSLDSLKSDYFYEVGRKIEPPLLKPLAVDEVQPLNELMGNIRWVSKDSAKLLAGFLVVAPLAGAIDWRPHIWITGGASTGKSTIVQGVISKVLKRYSHYFQGATTEAGIRQTIKSDSKAVIFDEFEMDDERSGNRIQSILELIRQASSETEGQVAKGTPSGQAIFYRPRFCALVSSIRVQLINEADRSRFAVLELSRHSEEGSREYDIFLRSLQKINKVFIDQFFSRNFSKLTTLKANIDVFWNVLRESYSARVGQQYGALLGGYWLTRHDEIVTKEEAAKLCASMNLSEARQIVDDKEELECIDFFIKKVLRFVNYSGHNMEKSLSEMIYNTWQEYERTEQTEIGPYREALDRIGVRIEGDFLFIAQRHPELAKIFNRTKWIAGWSKSLARIPGAENNLTKRIGGKATKCVRIPLNGIYDTTDGQPIPF